MPDTSFLPEDYLEKRLQRRTNLVSLLLFAVVMASVIGAFYVTDRQRSDIRQLQSQVNADFEVAAKRIEQLEMLQLRKQQMVQKAQVTALLLERIPRSLILAEIVNAMPNTVSLTELKLDSQVAKKVKTSLSASALEQAKQKAAAAKEAGKSKKENDIPQKDVTLSLVGIAPTDVEVSQFMTALGQCNLFSNVTLGFSEASEVDNQEVRRFRVEMSIDQTIDMAKYQPTLVKRDLRMNPMSNTTTIHLQPDTSTPNPTSTPSRTADGLPGKNAQD